jgi:pimeloyl-ACP methyl ester carboxylesterase
MKNMTADMAGLVQSLGERQAVIVGHDWGAPIAWTSAVLYPDVFRAVVGMSVPYLPRSPMPPLQLMRAAFGNNFFYIIYFQEPGVAEAELEADVDKSIRSFMYFASGDVPPSALGSAVQKPATAKFLDGMPDPPEKMSWITEDELQYFVKEFERTGFRGGLNRYRNMDRDWEELPQLAGAHVKQPSAFIAGDRDGVIMMNPAAVEGLKDNCDDLRMTKLLPGAGHWTQQERPREVNEFLIEFLKGL